MYKDEAIIKFILAQLKFADEVGVVKETWIKNKDNLPKLKELLSQWIKRRLTIFKSLKDRKDLKDYINEGTDGSLELVINPNDEFELKEVI